ncbi:glycosyltransferase (plasmid) [Proteus mirabilis]|uniref:glycosyltransferase n=1 Tax=Proteus mirabilis TaxID=584 RepID=UPI0038F76B87
MSELKKVTFVSLADLSEKNGQGIYARKVLPQIVQGLDSDTTIVDLICPEPKYNSNFKNEFTSSVQWRFFSKKINRSLIWHFKTQISILLYLLKRKPDVVVFSIKPSLFSIEIARWFIGFEKVILVEGLGSKNLKTLGGKSVVYLGNLGYKLNFYKAKAIIPAYKSAFEWVKTLNSHGYKEIIPCGVDTDVFKPVKDSELSSTEKITIGYVGSFRNVHRLDILLNLLVINESLSVVLIGNGEMYDEVQAFVNANKLNERVSFVGPIEQNQIPSYISSCNMMWAYTDISHWGVPIKAFEYLSCNKFVIASKRPEFNFIEEYGFGVTLSTDNVNEISLILNDIITRAKDEKIFDIDSFSYISLNNNWNNFKKVSGFI